MFLIDMDPHHQDEGYTAEQGPTLPQLFRWVAVAATLDVMTMETQTSQVDSQV